MRAKLINASAKVFVWTAINDFLWANAKASHRLSVLALIILSCTLVPASYADSTSTNILRISAAKSFMDSGVLQALKESFVRINPEIDLRLTGVGALEALKHGREGKADLVITHHPPGEKQFIDKGYGIDRTQFMYSEYVLFGPANELPELSKATEVISALKLLASEEVLFLVPNARSGTYRKIMELWSTAGINTNWLGFENTGISGADTLSQAAEMEAYTITDMSTYLVNRDELGDGIVPLFRGDFALRNIYSILTINTDKVSGVNGVLAKKFYSYLIAKEGQETIRRYGENTLNVSYLTPASDFDTNLREKRAQAAVEDSKRNLKDVTLLLIIVSILFVLSFLLYVRTKYTEKKRRESEALAHDYAVERDSALYSNNAKSRFLANMSHELRTPLNAIIGYSKLLEEETAEVGDHRYEKDLLCIDNAAHHLLSLINDILDLSKIESGKMVLDCCELNIRELSETVCETVWPLAKERGNNISCEVSSDVYTIYADEIRLRQVLLNLLSNACKFTKNGNVTLSVRNDFSQSLATCIFEVKDTGIGISKEKQAVVFDAFVQADDSTTKEFGGTGLGLAITKRFCELMMGEIKVQSDIGKGTSFIIKIPYNVENIKVAS